MVLGELTMHGFICIKIVWTSTENIKEPLSYILIAFITIFLPKHWE